MSVVLALGLSPLGQVPATAYADNGDAPIAAQAVSSDADAFGKAYQIETTDFTFDGSEWYNSGSPGETGTHKALQDYIVLSEGTTNATTGAVTYKPMDGDAITAALAAEDGFTISIRNNRTQETVTSLTDAGSYTVILKGKGKYNRKTLEASFTIKTLDFSGAQFVTKKMDDTGSFDAAVQKEINYAGKAQAVEYSTFPTIAVLDPNADQADRIAAAKTEAEIKNLDYVYITLKAGDFDFSPSMVTDRTDYTVQLLGKGNFTGSLETTATVGYGVFGKAGGMTINGAVNDSTSVPAAAIAEGNDHEIAATAGVSVDLRKANKNPKVGDSDPVAQGKVVFGETTLAKGDDYDFTYYTSTKDATGAITAFTETKNNAAPTAIGTGYMVEITKASGVFGNTDKTIRIVYDIVSASNLDEIADHVEFGSASYLADSTGAQHTEKDTFGIIAPSSAKFVNASGADVSAEVGSSYQLDTVVAWTADDEKELLGEEGYKAEYEFEDAGYENTEPASEVGWDAVQGKYVPVPADSITVNNKTSYGFAGLPAGDYKVAVKAAGTLSSGTVTGKFTVTKATAAEGAAVGQIHIEPGYAGYTGKAVTLKTSDGTAPVLTMVAGSDADDEPTYTDALVQGDNPYQVRNYINDADYYVTYEQDGKEVTPKDAGVYDAVFHFGGNNFNEATITKAAALEIGSPIINSYVDSVIVMPGDDYMYTGNGVEPRLVFLKESYDNTKYTNLTTAITSAKSTVTTNKGAEATAKSALASALADDTKTEADIETAQIAYDTAKAERVAAENALAKAQKALMEEDDVVLDIATEDYAVSYDMSSGAGASLTGGKPLGVGTYSISIKGAGKYTTKTVNGKQVPITVDGGFSIAALDLADDYVTVQFKDGDSWTDSYSATLDGATKLEPEYRVVTTATKDSESPALVSSKLYRAAYADNTAVGTASVVLSANPSQAALVTGENSYEFYIAAGKFSDESVGAAVSLTPATGAFTGDGHEVVVKVKDKSGNELAPQYSGSRNGQYIYTVYDRDGLEVVRSSTMTEAQVAAAMKEAIEGVGTYTVVVTGGVSHQYAGTLTAAYEVTAKEIKSTDKAMKIESTDTQYSGKKQTRAFAVSYEDAEKGTINFTKVDSAEGATGASYVITGNTGTDATTYTATIELCGDYTGKFEKTWKIEPVTIENLINNNGYYVMVDDKPLMTYADRLQAITDLADGTTTIAKLNKNWYNTDYNGQQQKPTVKILDAKFNELTGYDFTYLYETTTDASTYGAKVTIIAPGGNYTGRVSYYFGINGFDIASDRVSVAWSDDEITYNDGKPVEPKGTLTYTAKDGSKFDLKYGTDYIIQEYQGDNVNVGGEAYAKVVGLEPNFVAGDKTFFLAPFTVKEAAKKDIEVAAPTAKTGLKYTGSAQTGVAAATGYTVTGGSATNAGSYTATATLADGYVWADGSKAAKTVNWSIAKAANTLTVKAKSPSVKASKVKTKKRTIKAAKAFNVTKNVSGGKVTYEKASGSKKVNVASTGKVTVKKGTKKGTYTVKVKATSKATANYAAKTTAAFKLKVKVK